MAILGDWWKVDGMPRVFEMNEGQARRALDQIETIEVDQRPFSEGVA